jgi:hypothetical protein
MINLSLEVKGFPRPSHSMFVGLLYLDASDMVGSAPIGQHGSKFLTFLAS